MILTWIRQQLWSLPLFIFVAMAWGWSFPTVNCGCCGTVVIPPVTGTASTFVLTCACQNTLPTEVTILVYSSDCPSLIGLTTTLTRFGNGWHGTLPLPCNICDATPHVNNLAVTIDCGAAICGGFLDCTGWRLDLLTDCSAFDVFTPCHITPGTICETSLSGLGSGTIGCSCTPLYLVYYYPNILFDVAGSGVKRDCGCGCSCNDAGSAGSSATTFIIYEAP